MPTTLSIEPPGVLMSEEQEQAGTSTVRIDAELVRMARIICAHSPGRAGKQLKLVDYLDSLVRGPIQKRYREVLAEVAAKDREESKGRKPGK